MLASRTLVNCIITASSARLRSVASSQALRDQFVNHHSDQFIMGVSKEFRRARVRLTDHPIGIRDNNRVWRDLE
jgi:hypothetical protein